MPMRKVHHPLEKIPAERGRALFWPWLIATGVVMVILNWINFPLQTEAAPMGIVSYQLAGDVAGVERIIASWDARARVYAGFSLGLDYLFMPLYGVLFAWLCIRGAERMRELAPILARVGIGLAWGVWLAALLDATENALQFWMLVSAPRAPWPQVMWGCAVVKFGALALAGLYALASRLWAARGRR